MEKLTNIENNNLLDEFHGELLDGKIKLSSVRGYPSHPEKKQQDANNIIEKYKGTIGHLTINIEINIKK